MVHSNFVQGGNRANPYHFGPANYDEFVGRWNWVHQIAGDLAFGSSSFGCIAGRRCGKTSLLKVTEHILFADQAFERRVLPIFVDPMLYEFVSPGHVFATILKLVRDRVDVNRPVFDENASVNRIDLSDTSIPDVLAEDRLAVSAEQFGIALNTIFARLEQAGGPRRLAVLLDEMDTFLRYDWQTSFFEQLRASLYSGPGAFRLRVVLAGSRGFITAPSFRGSPLINLLEHIYLSPLDIASVRELCARSPNMPDDVKSTIWQQSGGHPFLAVYLLRHLWDMGTSDVTAQDVVDLADQFLEHGATHLDAWSQTLGLAGLQIFGLFVDSADWIDKKTIVVKVQNPRINVSEALSALSYHCFLERNPIGSRYRRAGEIFSAWYRNEIARLIVQLKPKDSVVDALPPFFLQLIHQGTLQAAFGDHIALAAEGGYAGVKDNLSNTAIDQRGQKVDTQYNVAGDFFQFGAAPDRTAAVAELRKLLEEITRAGKAGAIDEGTATDAEYQVKKAVQAAERLDASRQTIVDHLNQAKELITNVAAGVGAAAGLAATISQAIQMVQRLF